MGGQTVITHHLTATHLLKVTQSQVSTYQNILLFVFFNSEMIMYQILSLSPWFATVQCITICTWQMSGQLSIFAVAAGEGSEICLSG